MSVFRTTVILFAVVVLGVAALPRPAPGPAAGPGPRARPAPASDLEGSVASDVEDLKGENSYGYGYYGGVYPGFGYGYYPYSYGLYGHGYPYYGYGGLYGGHWW